MFTFFGGNGGDGHPERNIEIRLARNRPRLRLSSIHCNMQLANIQRRVRGLLPPGNNSAHTLKFLARQLPRIRFFHARRLGGGNRIRDGIHVPVLLLPDSLHKKQGKTHGDGEPGIKFDTAEDGLVRHNLHDMGMGKIDRIPRLPMGDALHDGIQMAFHNTDSRHHRPIRSHIPLRVLFSGAWRRSDDAFKNG
mgnify:CR=1 FL=1